jgi:hypothetical protein
MELDRQVQRQQIPHSGIVSVLGTTTQVLNAEILELCEGGTQIWLDQPLRRATLVRIEYSDNLLLGEVVYCEKEQAGWLVGIRIEHSLLGLKALARAMGAR